MSRFLPPRRSAWQTALVGLLAVAAFPALAARPAGGEPAGRPAVMRGKVLHVVDGDTLVLRPIAAEAGASAPAASAHPLRIRLAGIDAPELCQRGGGEARQALTGWVAGRQVDVAMYAVDRYARVVARVLVDGEDVSARLVAHGLAWSDSDPRRAGPYADLERQARSQGRGLFAQPDPQRPKDFRSEHGACAHAPGSRLRHLRDGLLPERAADLTAQR